MPQGSASSTISNTNTVHSISSQIGYMVRNMAHHGQPTIEIRLNDSYESTQVIPSFSTMDTIEGIVTVTAAHDTRFEDIDIALVGTSIVSVDKLTTTPTMTGRTEATHRFLLLRQPIPLTDFPAPRVFDACRTYEFPFTFTIPTQLLPKACSHDVTLPHIREAHMLLPPSLGEPELSGFGSALLDDLAPEMSRITYAIKVRIAHHARDAEGLSVLAEKSKKLRIKPAFEEQPPLNIDNNPEYRPQQERVVRKGLFKGKLGTVTARTIQPPPLVIPGARLANNLPITTMAKLVLRFDPDDENNAPPKVSSLTSKLKVSTYYASAPRRIYPSRASLGFDLSQGVYSENVSLSDLCISSAQWKKHSANTPKLTSDGFHRRDSGISDCSATSGSNEAFASGMLPASKNYKKGSFYTAQILVPIRLPLNKNFIPTFHCCLISRTYALSLQFHTRATSSMHLKVPIQICANGSEAGIENARARSVEESAFRQAADVFQPRFTTSPSAETQRNGSLGQRNELPPDYRAYVVPTTR